MQFGIRILNFRKAFAQMIISITGWSIIRVNENVIKVYGGGKM